MENRKPYPSDVSDDEWAYVAPYLTPMKEDAPQREHSPRGVFNGLRWLRAGGLVAIVHDLGMLLREVGGRPPQSRATILDSQALQSRPDDILREASAACLCDRPQCRKRPRSEFADGMILVATTAIDEGTL